MPLLTRERPKNNERAHCMKDAYKVAAGGGICKALAIVSHHDMGANNKEGLFSSCWWRRLFVVVGAGNIIALVNYV